MRRLTLSMVLLALALPACAAGPVTVQDLEKAAARAHDGPDGSMARELSELHLTERLSTARLMRMKAALPGEKSRQALLALADASVFLALPSGEIPAKDAPDNAAQDLIVAHAVGYLTKTIHMLPDLLATQQKVQFSDGPMRTSRLTGKSSWEAKFHTVSASSAPVRFIADRGDVENENTAASGSAPAFDRLTVEGTFGPMFGGVLKDALANHPAWSHWEPGTGAPVAVFHYSVAQEKSHFVLQYSTTFGVQSHVTAYSGEIALDPDTGEILRVTLLAAPESKDPIVEADVMVEYGPVEIGGKVYICPVRSVALSRSVDNNIMDGAFGATSSTQGLPLKVELNDVAYTQYHLFRTQLRVLAPDSEPSAEPPPAQPPQSPNR